MKTSFKEKWKGIPEPIRTIVVLILILVVGLSAIALSGYESPPDYYIVRVEVSPVVNGRVVKDYTNFAISIEEKNAGAYKINDCIPCGLYKNAGFNWYPIFRQPNDEPYYAVDTGKIIEFKKAWDQGTSPL